jgi:hypothetical protein
MSIKWLGSAEFIINPADTVATADCQALTVYRVKLILNFI